MNYVSSRLILLLCAVEENLKYKICSGLACSLSFFTPVFLYTLMIYLYVIFGRTGKILNKAGLFEVAKRSKDMSKSQVRIEMASI